MNRKITRELAAKLRASVTNFYGQYSGIDNTLASKRPGEGTWSPKEIIGHLIDSASNNHQRFIRLQIADQLLFPDYGKDNLKWVQLGHYYDLEFSDIMFTWKQYNVLIEKIIEEADQSSLANRWITGGKQVTLMELIADYVKHLQGHLNSFEETIRQLNP